MANLNQTNQKNKPVLEPVIQPLHWENERFYVEQNNLDYSILFNVFHFPQNVGRMDEVVAVFVVTPKKGGVK